MTMEILSNFASIYCVIAFVIGAVLMLVALAIVAMSKDDEPRNKVRFFIVKGRDICSDNIELWIGKLEWDKRIKRWIPSTGSRFLSPYYDLKDFNLNPDDFDDMKEGEIREVFINLED